MAGIDIRKRTTQTMPSVNRHNYRQSDDGVKRSNTDIDPSKTHLNYSINHLTEKESQEKHKKRIEEVDRVLPPKRIRKDRVTAITMVTYCPPEIKDMERSDEFFQKAHETICKTFGGEENIIDSVVHKDEVHDYLKKEDGKIVTHTSREHMHTTGIPFVPDKGINGKQFVTKTFLHKLNNEMENMCQREFGIHYHTGKGHEDKCQNELKAESAKLQREEAEKSYTEYIDEMNEHLTKMDERIIEQKEYITEQDETIDKMNCEKEKLLTDLEQMIKAYEKNLTEPYSKREKRMKAFLKEKDLWNDFKNKELQRQKELEIFER